MLQLACLLWRAALMRSGLALVLGVAVGLPTAPGMPSGAVQRDIVQNGVDAVRGRTAAPTVQQSGADYVSTTHVEVDEDLRATVTVTESARAQALMDSGDYEAARDQLNAFVREGGAGELPPEGRYELVNDEYLGLIVTVGPVSPERLAQLAADQEWWLGGEDVVELHVEERADGRAALTARNLLTPSTGRAGSDLPEGWSYDYVLSVSFPGTVQRASGAVVDRTTARWDLARSPQRLEATGSLQALPWRLIVVLSALALAGAAVAIAVPLVVRRRRGQAHHAGFSSAG